MVVFCHNAQVVSAFIGGTGTITEEKVFNLYKRHADDVLRVMNEGFENNKERLLKGNLPSTSLLALFFNRSKVIEEVPSNYDEQLKEILDKLNSLQQPNCYFYVNEKEKKLLFKGGYEIEGVNFDLISELLPNFRKDKQGDCVGSSYYSSKMLAKKLLTEEAALRRKILRFRDEVHYRLAVDQDIVLDGNDFIESVHGKGYRLNPELIEVTSVRDLR